MVQKIILPKQGLQMETGLLVRWLKAPGDAVAVGEAVAEMETDKVTAEIESPADGVLLKILHDEGATVPVGEMIAWLGNSMDEVSLIPAGAVHVEPASVAEVSVELKTAAPAAAVRPSDGRIFSSPRARLRAEERGVALDRVAASGPDGLIIERDVPLSATPVAASGTSAGRPVAFDRTRRYIADKMLESLREKAQVTHTMHLDMTSMITKREEYKARGIKVSYNDLMVKACAAALRVHPQLNRTVVGGQMIEHTDVHIGVAVAVDGGLMVPVIRNAHWINTEAVAAESIRLIEAVRKKMLTAQDTEGGTFTISNLGMYEIDEFQAVINPPQSAILAVGRIAERVAVIGGMIAIRPMCTVTLTYDHCVVDGAPAAQFMQTLKGCCEKLNEQ